MTHQEMRLDAEPLEAEPTLGQLENQEPQDQIDEEKIEAEEAEAEMEAETFIPDEEPETFVALSLETVRTLVATAGFPASMFPNKSMDMEVLNKAISEAAHAYAQATGQPPPLPLKPYSPFGRHDGFETISPQDAEYLRGEPVRPNGTTEPFFPDGEEAL